MAAIILPNRWRQQPHGPVDVDHANQLSARIAMAWLGSNHLVNCVNRARCVSSSGPSIVSGVGGIGIKWPTIDYAGLQMNTSTTMLGQNNDGDGGFTVAMLAEPSASSSRHAPYCCVSGVTPYVYVVQNRTFVDTDSSGRFAISATEATGAQTGTDAIDGKLHWFISTQTAGAGTTNVNAVYIDGILATSSSSDTSTHATTANADWIGGFSSAGYAVTEPLYALLTWNRVLSPSEIALFRPFAPEPWRIFKPLRRRLYFFSAGGAGAISADAALLEANDTLSASTTATISATANIAEDNDTSSSGATVAIAATAALGESADALAAEGTVAFPGVTATATLAESDDALTSAVSVVLTGTASLAEANDALAASGAVAITAAAALLEANDALTSEGGTASFAAATIEEASDGLTATGTVLVTGAAAIAEAADALASAVTVSLTANAALLEANDLLSASGSVGNVVRTADAALVEAPDQASATAAVTVTGAAAIIEAGDIVVSGVTVLVTANAALVEENDGLTSSGTAMFGVFADAALQEANDVLTSAVVQKIARRIAASDAGRWTITSSDGLN